LIFSEASSLKNPIPLTGGTASVKHFATLVKKFNFISLHPIHELRHKQPHLNGHREMRTPRAAGFIASFKVTPLEIFRVNKGPSIFLREWAAFPPQRSTIFDLHTYEGKVLPKALNEATYQCKLFIIYLSSYLTSILVLNGASMRPNGRYQQGLVRRLSGRDWIVYSIPKGWLLP
jgi:hypothetical protein